MKNDETIRIYDRRAADYAKLSAKDHDGDPQLERFIAVCAPGGRALDLGCGPGHAAARMAAAGLEVDAIDASEKMVELARSHPGVTAWQATFDDVTMRARYDGIWASFSLLHAARANLPRHLRAIHKALRPGGVFYIGLKLGTGEGPDKIGRTYTYYEDAELTALLQEAGFEIETRRYGRSKGLDGSMADWIAVLARA